MKTKKELEHVAAELEGILERQKTFEEALESGNVVALIETFVKEGCAHIMMLPDMVEDPDVKVTLMQLALNATTKSKIEIERLKSISEMQLGGSSR